jgi:hypothetical protein
VVDDGELDNLFELAGCSFRDAMTTVEIEAFFSRRQVSMAEGTSKRTLAQNTLASLPRTEALELVLEFARERRDIGLEDRVYILLDKDQPEISAITRDRVADRLGVGIHGLGVRPDVIEDLFDLSSTADFFYGPSKIEELKQHATGAAPSWSAKDVFDVIGAITCPSRRFTQLIETALDPRFRDVDDQAALAADLDGILQLDGYEVVQTGEVSGRATFSVRPIRRGVDGRPKNLIFASKGPKPRLGFSDAIDNEVVLLEHADSCLVYDQPIGSGLLWLDLVRWWMNQREIADLAEARTSLGQRLLASLDDGPEQEFFKAYFRNFADRLGDRLPALIPQVYLHYDPEIARHLADKRVLFRQRMDFLMLLPNRQRIVLEIDGKHHYANGERADPRLYAEMVEADRKLRLRGYEVFRFGGWEFFNTKGSKQEAADKLVRSFFEELFLVHRLG